MLKHFQRLSITLAAAGTGIVCLLVFTARATAQSSTPPADQSDDLLRWWPLLCMAAGLIAWAVRTEALAKTVAKSVDKDIEDLRGEFLDKLTSYATTTEVAEVRGHVMVAISSIDDLKPTLTRLENKLDAFLIARVREGRLDP